MSIEVLNICAKFHSVPSTKHGDIASHVLPDGQTDNGWPDVRRPEDIILSIPTIAG